jgi:sugar lactone lactonase YvrE
MMRWQTRAVVGLVLAAPWLMSRPPAAGQWPQTGDGAVHPASAPGTLIRVVGTGAIGFSRDGTPATEAKLNVPHGPAFDAAGTMFFADTLNHRVRKLDGERRLVTVAGTGAAGFRGDSGLATAARVNWPKYVTVDGEGNLYFNDNFNGRVRKVDPQGIITTVAGGGTISAAEAEGALAATATLTGVAALTVDAAGDLLLAHYEGDRVLKVSRGGVLTTVAGGGVPADGVGDGGPATMARLEGPSGLAVDAVGNLYITEFGDADFRSARFGNRVRKVTPDGIISTVAGTGRSGFSGDGGPATAAELTRPITITVDSAGNLFIADWGNYRVRKVTPNGIISTVAGIGKSSQLKEDVPATEAGLRGPFDLSLDREGSLFISDTGFLREDNLGQQDRIVKVVAAAAPGLLAGRPFPRP